MILYSDLLQVVFEVRPGNNKCAAYLLHFVFMDTWYVFLFVIKLRNDRVDIHVEVVICEDMTPQCVRLMVLDLVVRVDIGVVIYEAMTPQCGRSVVKVLVVRVDIGVVTYEAMTPQCGRSVFRSWLSELI